MSCLVQHCMSNKQTLETTRAPILELTNAASFSSSGGTGRSFESIRIGDDGGTGSRSGLSALCKRSGNIAGRRAWRATSACSRIAKKQSRLEDWVEFQYWEYKKADRLVKGEGALCWRSETNKRKRLQTAIDAGQPTDENQNDSRA